MFSLLTFAQIFDPVRALMVEGKILDWFSYRGSFVISTALVFNFNYYAESHLYQWLRRNTIDRLTIKPADTLDIDTEANWQERQDAETALRSYLDDLPSMSSWKVVYQSHFTSAAKIAFLHGPQGSGKSKMLSRILQDKKRYS